MTNRTVTLSLLIASAALLITSACMRHASTRPDDPMPIVSEAAAKALATQGKGATLSVLPTSLAGHPSLEVAEVVAVMLERGGMQGIALDTTSFTPPTGAEMLELTESLSAHVRAQPPAGDFVLFTEMLGTPGRRIEEVRIVIVNRQGEVAWADRQRGGDQAFDRAHPGEPLEGCTLIADRLRPVLGLDDTRREGAPGPIEQARDRETGLPDPHELAMIEARGKEFAAASNTATIAVYPAQIGRSLHAESATSLASMINKKGPASASVASAEPPLVTHSGMNQQRRLWSLARSFSDFIRANPPQADYALMADYQIGGAGVGGVHAVICDRNGDIVWVELQNSHQPDFGAVNPRNREGCDRLVVWRLEQFMSR